MQQYCPRCDAYLGANRKKAQQMHVDKRDCIRWLEESIKGHQKRVTELRARKRKVERGG